MCVDHSTAVSSHSVDLPMRPDRSYCRSVTSSNHATSMCSIHISVTSSYNCCSMVVAIIVSVVYIDHCCVSHSHSSCNNYIRSWFDDDCGWSHNRHWCNNDRGPHHGFHYHNGGSHHRLNNHHRWSVHGLNYDGGWSVLWLHDNGCVSHDGHGLLLLVGVGGGRVGHLLLVGVDCHLLLDYLNNVLCLNQEFSSQLLVVEDRQLY